MAGINPNFVDFNNRLGYVLGSTTDRLIKDFAQTETPGIDSTYRDQIDAIVTGSKGGFGNAVATDSLFNPFYVFRYSKFGSSDGKRYDPSLHRDGTILRPGGSEGGQRVAQKLEEDQRLRTIENPSAQQIISWTREHGADNLGGNSLATMPYQWSDFLWCKYYGLIPNNRLLTLRRFPIPVEDRLQVKDGPLIPIAQAVTWWGGETGNKLTSILGIEYGFNWLEKTADVKVVHGNEPTADDLLSTLGISDPDKRRVLIGLGFTTDGNTFEAIGDVQKKIQEYVENSYGDTGPYWHKIRGPVNVIDRTLIRGRGFSFNSDVTLKFSYKLRSYSNINPKVAMLDLIGNFLSLTHNRADFWGGSNLYFKKPGVLAGVNNEAFNEGKFVDGIIQVIKDLASKSQNKFDEISKLFSGIVDDIAEGDLQAIAGTLDGSPTARAIIGSWMAPLVQTPLLMRSFLDGRAVGEWHLTVGNPMNPVAVMGNLCVRSTKMEFSDSVGLDDFPSEVTFTVKLSHGRPRAKQDIESMFNLGGGDLYFSQLAPPASASNSYGEETSTRINKAYSEGYVAPSAADNRSSSALTTVKMTETSGLGSTKTSTGVDPIGAVNFFGPRVSRAYGDKFGSSPMLIDYFTDLKTMD